MTQPSKWRAAVSALFALILAAGAIVEIRGFQLNDLFVPHIWEPQGLRRLLRYLAFFVAVGLPVLVLAPWSFAGIVAALAAAGTVLSAGVLAPLAVLYFLISASALGSLILGRAHETSIPGQARAAMVGTAVCIFFMTLTARTPIHYPAVWVALLALPIACDWRGTRARLAAIGRFLADSHLGTWGERGAAALLAFVLGMHWLVALKPEISADGLAMHLAIPANIAAYHRMTFEPTRFIWAVMPMGADWIFSILNLLGGEIAARLVNLAMLVAIVAMVYGASRRWLSRAASLLLAALFATTPMVQLVTGSLFVENLLTALVLALLTVLWTLGDSGNRRALFAAALLAGAALTTKFGAVAYVVLILPLAIWETRRQWRALGPRAAGVCALALLLFALTAAPTYAIAWHKTHNPLYPFLNRKFPSPLLDPTTTVEDPRYHDRITPATLFDLTFHTEKFYEARDGSFGFQYLVLAPMALAGLVAVRRRPAMSAALVGIATAVAILRTNSNARYIYSSLPIVTIAIAPLLAWTAAHRRALYYALISGALLCAGLNLYFLPASGWYHRDFYSPFTFGRHSAQRYIAEVAPERAVIDFFNRTHAGSTVMLTADTSIAGLRGDVYENSWHQWNIAIAMQRVLSFADFRQLFRQWHIAYFISPTASSGIVLQPPNLREFLDLCATTEFQVHGYALSHLDAACRGYAPLQAVPAGTYDDFDDALKFQGIWGRSRAFDGTYRHTVTFTDTPNAQVEFVFTGHAVTYGFTKAPNRGLADVSIDGISQGAIDLYSPDIEWQSGQRFSGFTPGRHTICVRVAGKKSPGATGQFVDIDRFVVE